MKSLAGVRTAALIAAFLAVAPAWAQTRSTVTGTVRDSTGAVLPGVTVTLESPDLVGGAQTDTSSDKGGYRFINLPPGTYQLTAQLSGFQTVKRSGLRILFGTTATIDVSLGVGSTETLTVEGRSPAVDVTTAQATSKVDVDLIQSIPIMRDQGNGFEVFQLSPGINGRSSFGGARDANELLMDGVPTTIPERQGTNAAVVATNWLEEVQVVSLGASAEYGEFTGTVANFVVRSGSNEFHGLFEYKTTRPSWAGDNTQDLAPNLRTRFTSQQILSQWDSTAQVGGPIKKDALFFFAGFHYQKNETRQAGAPSPSNGKNPRFVGKVNWAASKSVKLDATVNSSKATTSGGALPGSTAEVASNISAPITIWTARASWAPSARTLVEVRTGGLDYVQDIDPMNGGRNGPSPRRDTVTGISSVNAANYRLQEGTRLNLGANLTHFVDGGLGKSHELKVGVDHERFSFLTEQGLPSGRSFQDRNGVPDLVTLWAGDVREGIGNRTTLYAQDNWKLTDSFTLEPGLRASFHRGSTPTTGDIWATNPVSPRIGAAWDVGAGHKTVVRAHYGRYHEGFGTVLYDFTDTSRQTPQITARVLGPNSFQEINRVNPAGNLLDRDISHAFMDQFIVGVERELIADLSVKAQYIHRDFKNMWGYIDTVSIYTPVQVRDPGPDGVAGGADAGGVLTVFNLQNPGVGNRTLTNPDGAYRRYRAFQVVAQKRFSNNWQLLASYTRSRARGNVNNDIVDNFGGSNAASNPFVNPNNAINAEGRNALDYPHDFTVRGSYRIDALGGFNVGAVYRYVSGGAWSRTAVFRLSQGNQTVRVAPRGSEPSGAFNQADLRFDKTFPLGSRSRQLSLYLDVYNISNQGAVDRARYTEASGGTFGTPLGWVAPRTFQISGRVSF